MRVDRFVTDDFPLYNPNVLPAFNYVNNSTVNGLQVIQPRTSFNYTFDTERPTQLRGGVGLFGGAAPNVWLAGAYQNTGLNYVEYTVRNPDELEGVFTPNINPPYIPPTGADPACTPVPTLDSCPRANVDIVEPGMKLPSVWKANLALDHELPWYGIVASAELLLSNVVDSSHRAGPPSAVDASARCSRPALVPSRGL